MTERLDTRSAATPAGKDSERVVDLSEAPPLGELISQAADDVTTIMRKEVELAKLEIHEEIGRAKSTGIALGAAAMLGYLAVILLSFAAAWGLAAVLPAGWAFCIVGALFAVAAAIAFTIARRTLRAFSPVPEQTIETLKEDVQWAQHPTR